MDDEEEDADTADLIDEYEAFLNGKHYLMSQD